MSIRTRLAIYKLASKLNGWTNPLYKTAGVVENLGNWVLTTPRGRLIEHAFTYGPKKRLAELERQGADQLQLKRNRRAEIDRRRQEQFFRQRQQEIAAAAPKPEVEPEIPQEIRDMLGLQGLKTAFKLKSQNAIRDAFNADYARMRANPVNPKAEQAKRIAKTVGRTAVAPADATASNSLSGIAQAGKDLKNTVNAGTKTVANTLAAPYQIYNNTKTQGLGQGYFTGVDAVNSAINGTMDTGLNGVRAVTNASRNVAALPSKVLAAPVRAAGGNKAADIMENTLTAPTNYAGQAVDQTAGYLGSGVEAAADVLGDYAKGNFAEGSKKFGKRFVEDSAKFGQNFVKDTKNLGHALTFGLFR